MSTYSQRSGSNDRGLVSSNNNHATAIASATANAGVENSGDDFASDDFFTPTYYIRRSAMEFSSLPAVITSISAGQITITFANTTGDTNNYSVNLFYFTRGSAAGGAFDTNDFDNAVGTAACDSAKDITGLTGSQTFTLNAAALAHIKNNAGGYVQFSARISGDYAASASTGTNLINGYRGHDATESNRPLLEFTYVSSVDYTETFNETVTISEPSYTKFLTKIFSEKLDITETISKSITKTFSELVSIIDTIDIDKIRDYISAGIPKFIESIKKISVIGFTRSSNKNTIDSRSKDKPTAV
jgi:hypothetical protein